MTENHYMSKYDCSSESLVVQYLPTGTNFRLFHCILLVQTVIVRASGNTTRKRVCCFICFFKQALTLWGYGDALALIKEILIQTERSKLNELLVYAPHPLKVCVECTWLSFKKTLLIGIKRGWMWPQAVQCLTHFLSLCDPVNTSRPLAGICTTPRTFLLYNPQLQSHWFIYLSLNPAGHWLLGILIARSWLM